MKKKLLKPPENNNEILLIPDYHKIKDWLSIYQNVITAHQPYFFNPGVALKFLFLNKLNAKNKKIIFLDTDISKLLIKIPVEKNKVLTFTLIDSKEIFYSLKSSDISFIKNFLTEIEMTLLNYSNLYKPYIENFKRYKDLLIKNLAKYTYFKEVLAESFMSYYNISIPYDFFSNIINRTDYKEFEEFIIQNHDLFRSITNKVLDEFKNEYRFRFKNFPYPKLKENELPFWTIKENLRFPCTLNDLSDKKVNLIPRSILITTYMRLFVTDIFIHGVGGANYEPLHDKIITKFFKKSPKPYFIISGTFYINKIPYRDIPFFLINPEKIQNALSSILSN